MVSDSPDKPRDEAFSQQTYVAGNHHTGNTLFLVVNDSAQHIVS
jgi:hypothetical protein